MTFEEWYFKEYGEEVAAGEAEYARAAFEGGRRAVAEETLAEMELLRADLEKVKETVQGATRTLEM